MMTELNIDRENRHRQEGLVSVIVPCFNSQAYLRETLDSLIEQTYSNWECIIIDDHSADGTRKIIDEYINRFPTKISFFPNRGKGACVARNFGMDESRGQFIKFLDSDDALFDAKVLADQVSFLIKTDSDIVFGNELYYQDEFEEKFQKKKRAKPLSDDNIHRDFFNRFPITSNFLLRSSNADVRWSEELKSGQEFHFLFTCYLNRFRFNYEDRDVAKIRIHNSIGRITNKKPMVYASQTFQLVKRMTLDLERFKIDNIEFLTSFNLWKLRWSYFAYSAKNFEAFHGIQKLLSPLDSLKIQSKRQESLYRMNQMSSLIAFAYHQFYLKILKKSIL